MKADGRFAVAAVAAVAVAGGAVLFLLRPQTDTGSLPDEAAPVAMTAPATTVPSGTADGAGAPTEAESVARAPEAVEDAGPEPGTPDDPAPDGGASPPSEAATGLSVPRFDHVRVDKDGRAVISGTAPSGFDVAVEVDGNPLFTMKTDRTGQFAGLLSLPVSDAAQVVNLVARNAEGVEVRSEDSVILAPRMETGPEIVTAEPSDGTRDEEEMAAVDGVAEPEPGNSGTVATPAVTGADETAQDTPYGDAMAPTVLLASRTGVELLQPANDLPERLRDRVVIDVISYSDDGSVALEGRAAASGDRADGVRVYLDNRPVQSANVEPGGRWHMRLTQVVPGVYTLRVDQIDPNGRVVARFETPFKREAPAELARLVPQLGATGAVGASVITVQPGYTLWGIATDRYGSGLDYVQIFDANKSQIRDPDLIYPGQIFELPDQ